MPASKLSSYASSYLRAVLWLALIYTICFAAAADAVGPGMATHTFRFSPPSGSPTVPVSVAADFNGWSAAANPMARDSDGNYSVTVTMPVGLHHYKIVYDGKWIPDPEGDKSLEFDDGFKGKNSGFNAVAGGEQVPVAQGKVSHTFRFAPATDGAKVPVSVVGDFNGWSAAANPMSLGIDGDYSTIVEVSPGLHHYKIVYDGKWIPDPAGDKSLEFDDGFKGKNSGFNAVAETGPPAVGAEMVSHTFRYAPPAGAATVPVSVVGDFNSWSAPANPMVRGADGIYTATVAVSPGLHHYKIVYDGKWIPDPDGDKSLEFDDGFKGKNSGFNAVVGEKPILHKFRYVPLEGAGVVPVNVTGDWNGWSATADPMTRAADGSYSTTIPVPPGLHHYKIIYDGKWLTDPTGDKSLEFDDGFKGKNSGFIARTPTAPAAATPPAPSPLPVGGVPIVVPHGSSLMHVFRFFPPEGSPTVPTSVAGDFNGWSAAPNPLVRGDDGVYTAAVETDNGAHHYKIVYDGKWIADPADDKSLEEDDGFGGKNSGFVAGLEADQLPAPAAGAIDGGAVVFDPANVANLDVISSSVARLSFRARADDVTEATVIAGQTRTPMSIVSTVAGMNMFAAVVTPAPFVFELRKPGAVAYVADGRAYPQMPTQRYTPSADPTFVTPDWAKHAVWYQILPERFRNGDPSNDPPHTVAWKSKWYDVQPGETGDFYTNVWDRRYGGDLQGIREKLPYLRSLGITAIYLNPIFQAPSLHKYNTTDYRHVDEHFGVAGDIEKLQGETDDPATWQWTASDKIFLDLVADAHRQGFHVIIDGVYNHVGTNFWAFQDVLKNGKDSKYADWFNIIDWTPSIDKSGHPYPFHYWAWDGENGEAPEFRKDPVIGIVHGPREHIMAIAKRWLEPDGDPSRGVDGFRLDAPEKVPHPFWIDFRKMIKGIKPDALIDGEIWPWAQAWLSGDQFDCVTNYQFAVPAQAFFVNQKTAIPPTAMAAVCNRLVMDYPFQVAMVNQNLLDSHDTDRAASMFVNPDLGFNSGDRVQDDHSTYSPRKPNEVERQRMLQEVAFQMTFVGAPMIYYGDEAGMWGAGDPSDRQPMTWQDLGQYDDPEVTFDTGKFEHYQRLIAIRRKLPALQTGFYRKLLADDTASTFTFARDLDDQHVYIALNRSNRPATIKLAGVSDQKLIDWMDPSNVEITTTADRPEATLGAAPHALDVVNGSIEIQLPAYGTAIIAPPAP